MLKNVYLLFSFLCLLVLFGCKSDGSSEAADLDALEAEARSTKDPEAVGALMKAYEAEIAAHPNDAKQNSAYLRKAADIFYETGRFTSAAEMAQRSLREYPKAESVPATALYLGQLYEEKLGASESALSIYQALQQGYPQSSEAQTVAARVADIPPFAKRLDSLLTKMVDPQTGRADYRMANDYINSVENYLLIDSKLVDAPTRLYMSAEVARSIRMHQQALDFYDWIIADYPDFSRTPKAYFMRAFTLDEDLKRPDEAKEAYQTFIQKYPNDDFADDAQALLDNIGKSEEEIFQEFEKKRQEQEKKGGS